MLSLLTLTARAHVGDVVAGIDLDVESPDGALIEASYGLLLPDGPSYAWVCHEAVTSPGAMLSPRYIRLESGALFAVMPDPAQGRDGQTAFRSEGGCDWSVPSGLEGAAISTASSSGATVLAAAGPGGIYRSEDDGLTFSPWRSAPDRRALSVKPVRPDLVWAAATDDAGERIFLWRYAEGAWTEREIPRPSDTPAPVSLKLSEPEADRVLLVVDPLGADVLYEATLAGETRIDTGTPGAITDIARDGERLWVVRDGLFLLSIEGSSPPELHPSFPPGIGIAADGSALWTAPQSQIASSLLSRSADGGETFETLAHPDDIAAPLACPPESDAATVCEPLWETLLPRIRGFDSPAVDTGTNTDSVVIPPHPDDEEELPASPPTERGCGCGLPARGGWLSAIGIALAWRRRRP